MPLFGVLTIPMGANAAILGEKQVYATIIPLASEKKEAEGDTTDEEEIKDAEEDEALGDRVQELEEVSIAGEHGVVTTNLDAVGGSAARLNGLEGEEESKSNNDNGEGDDLEDVLSKEDLVRRGVSTIEVYRDDGVGEPGGYGEVGDGADEQGYGEEVVKDFLAIARPETKGVVDELLVIVISYIFWVEGVNRIKRTKARVKQAMTANS
ncbi:unnamed protein product [Clonostachys solani]|uniref:Uncharacterized protein n=1 Tax=Clonostachys solani TaxID=160281 RepID=A0A9N9ZHG5_9HYPO|nr:unnamed protein product [Clonostachys solani]